MWPWWDPELDASGICWNSCFSNIQDNQHLPSTAPSGKRKLADVSPLPKKQLVKDLKIDLRPISLTPRLSNVAEDCVVIYYVKSTVLKVPDPDNSTGRFPSHWLRRPNLLHVVHCWAKETNGNGATMRTILFDCRKEFGLIDHKFS